MKTDGVPVIHALFARLRTLGVDVPSTFRAAGLPVPATANAEPGRLRLTTQKYFALWEAIAQVSGDRAIGLRIGAETLHGQLDAMSLAALHSAQLRRGVGEAWGLQAAELPGRGGGIVQRDEAAVTFRWLLADGFVPDVRPATFASALAWRGADRV